MTDARHFDVVVVGAGIVGLGAAHASARRGARVLVIDRSSDPTGATVRNFGHLCIGAQSGAARAYADLSRVVWRELATTADFWLRATGTAIIARNADELALLHEAATSDDLELWDAEQTESVLPITPGVAVGGGRLMPDLQTDPRTAASAIRRLLARRGVTFLLRTSVGAVRSGTVETSRGRFTADLVVVAVNHDLDQLLPDVAEDHEVERCALAMLRGRLVLRHPLAHPLLTGWSLIRYGRFAALPGAAAVRLRLHAERPDLAAWDLNQMYTQLPDGSLVIGDTHTRAVALSPFEREPAARLLLQETETLFGVPVTVVERWQGVYATAPSDFLQAEPAPGVVALGVTNGIGMTCGLGLAEAAISYRLDPPGIHPARSGSSLEGDS